MQPAGEKPVVSENEKKPGNSVGLIVDASSSRAQHLHNDSAGLNYLRSGKQLDTSSLIFPRDNNPIEQLIAVTSLFIFFGLFYAVPLATMWALGYALISRSSAAALFLTFIGLDYFLPAGRVWPAFRHWKLWDIWRRYFKTCIILPQPPCYDLKMNYMIAQFPHASFPMAAFLVPVLAGEPATGVPGPTGGVIASILLTIPIFKHIFAWSACLPATEANILKLLAKGPVGMIPEGVAGIFEGATRDRERIFVKSRKGFIRVAIKAGVDIIPVYHFGNSQLLRYSGSEFLSRKVRATVGVFWGRYGLAPHPAQLITALAAPVKVEQNDDPSGEQVDETHARFLAAIQDLYYQHRHLYGWQNRDLELR